MLAFILLVVLGGGVGLLAVSLAESSKPATDAGSQRRGSTPDVVDPEPVDDGTLAPSEPVPEPPEPPEPPAEAAGTVLVHTRSEPLLHAEPQPVPSAPRPDARPRRPPIDPRKVPRAFTAIEGTYAEVARPPVWRRILSLVGVLLIAVAIGVGLAAFLGAVIGAAGEILGNTIE